ncbi:MAG: hypothetical protein MRY83_20020 [Flavobacteriales bacterium]|nr:hypothetical protein [Flavobacteriales bacterium]
MKWISRLGFIVLFFVIQSCYKPGKINIQNNISNVKLDDVSWGDITIGTDLLPGESTGEVLISKHEEKLPSTQVIRFSMIANGISVYLETQESYELDEDDNILIILDDDTPVRNPSE